MAALLEPKDGIFQAVLKKSGIEQHLIYEQNEKNLKKLPQVTSGIGQIYLSQNSNNLFDQALKESVQLHDEFVSN